MKRATDRSTRETEVTTDPSRTAQIVCLRWRGIFRKDEKYKATGFERKASLPHAPAKLQLNQLRQNGCSLLRRARRGQGPRRLHRQGLQVLRDAGLEPDEQQVRSRPGLILHDSCVPRRRARDRRRRGRARANSRATMGENSKGWHPSTFSPLSRVRSSRARHRARASAGGVVSRFPVQKVILIARRISHPLAGWFVARGKDAEL